MIQRTKELIEKAQSGDKNAMELLLIENVGLITSIAKKYAGNGVDLEDLIQEGYIGFMRGVDNFNLSSGNELSTYVYWWIVQSCSKYLAKHSTLIRVPANLYENIIKVKKFEANFKIENGKEPELDDYIRTGLSEANINKALWAISNIQTPLSLDALVQLNDEGVQIREFVRDMGSDIEDLIFNEEVKLALYDAMNQILVSNHIDILIMRYGLNGKELLSFEKIGKKCGISRERARRIEKRSLINLKRELSEEKYEDMFGFRSK